MSEAKPLDRARIEKAFRIMGQYLLDRKALGEIAIYGGSASAFRFDWRKSSQDGLWGNHARRVCAAASSPTESAARPNTISNRTMENMR